MDLARIKAPRQAGRIQLIAERLVVEAGPFVWTERPLGGQRLHEIGRATAAAPAERRKIDGMARFPGDQVLVCDEAFVELRREHSVGNHELMRHIEVGLGVAVRDVDVRAVGGTANLPLQVEPIHLAVLAGRAAVARLEKLIRRMVDLIVRGQTNRLQRYDGTRRAPTAGHSVGAGKALEEVVEAAIFLHDDHDVRNAARRLWARRRSTRVCRRHHAPGQACRTIRGAGCEQKRGSEHRRRPIHCPASRETRRPCARSLPFAERS